MIGNTLAEAEETLTVSGTATGFGAIPSATLTIIDNDTDIAPTEITLSLSETGAAEGASPTVTVTATLSPTNVTLPDATVVTVTVGDSGDTATEGTDYTTVGDITVTIPAGVASGTGTFQLQATDDEFADTPETVTVSGTADGFTINQLTLAISDDDVVPTSIVLMPDPASVDVAEGASSRVEVIALFEPSGSVLEVDTRVSVVVGAGGDTATEGTDYTEVGDFTITIPALSPAGMGTFEFAVTDDAVADPGETVTVSGTAAPVLPIDPVMLTIIDGDEAPTEIVLSLSPSAEGENASRTITVTATLSPTSVTLPDDTVVTVTVGDSGDSATEGVDYTAVGDFPITILEGETSGTGTFLFEVTRDGIVDPDETVTVSGTTTATTITTITDVTLAINNIDTAPTVIVLTHDRGSVTNEGADREITVTATLSPAVALTADTVVTVTVGDTEDSATEGTDYTAVDDFTIIIPREVTSGTGSFQWTVVADVVYDPDESITISATAGGFDPITSLTLPINDQNTAPTGIQLSLSQSTVAEGASPMVTVTAAFLPNTSDALPVDTLVTVTVAGTTATTGTDYTTAPSSFTITIPATMTSGTSDIAVQVVDDMLAEEPETVTVSGTAAPVLPITPATLTIDDNDTAPTEITLSLSETGADEGASPTVTVMATLSGTVSLTADTVVTVTVGDTGDSATEVTDYIPVVDLLVTIAAGTTSGMSTFLFVPTDDTVHDPDETVTVSGTADGFDPITSLTLAINDTDTAPTEITLSATPPRVTEGATPTVTVTATLSPTSVTLTGATEVTVSVGPGTAQAADFTAVGNVTVTIAAGATSGTGTFVLTVTASDGVDADETVTVSGTTTADHHHHHHIRDADDRRHRRVPDIGHPVSRHVQCDRRYELLNLHHT